MKRDSIGIVGEFHWILLLFPLDLDLISIGIDFDFHWKTRTIRLGLSVKEACLDGASSLRVACVSLGFCGREGLSLNRSHLKELV